MKRSFGIRAKLQLIVGSAFAFILVFLLTVVYFRTSSLVRDLLEGSAGETAARFTSVLGAKANDALVVARTVGQILQDASGEAPAQRRLMVDSFIKSVLNGNPSYLSVWTTWEPNALDGLDARFRNTPYGNEVGRIDLTWYRGKDDTLKKKVSSEKELQEAEYYQVPKKSNQDVVIGPYMYSYEEGAPTYVEYSLMSPIRNQDAHFIGVVGIDVPQSAFQVILQDIKPYGDGYAALYTSAGLIAAHAEKEMVAKSIDDEASLFSPAEFKAYSAAIKGGKDTSLVLTRAGKRVFVAVRPFRVGSTYTR
jgi:methyl-accepting chemotaxis protein